MEACISLPDCFEDSEQTKWFFGKILKATKTDKQAQAHQIQDNTKWLEYVENKLLEDAEFPADKKL